MSKAFALASRLDQLGLRRPVARLATLLYPGQSFWEDEQGRWVNSQRDCTIVSPTIHTAQFQQIKAWVLDTWCLKYVPSDGDTVIDVGSGVGEEAVVFSQLVGPAGRVVAIEAHPATHACLEQTIERSNLSNVLTHHCAVADGDGELVINTLDNHLANSVVSDGPGERIPARSLDSLSEELKLGEVNFLKMNIEGAEKLAVLGMSRLAPRIQNLCISCHDFVAEATGEEAFRSREKVQSILVALGFQVRTRDWTPDKPWHRDYLFGTRAN